MTLDIEDYRFMGLANTVAMEECSASFEDDRDNVCCLSLLREYKEAGSPKSKREWLRVRLQSMFTYFDHPPRWVQTPMWPFCKGQAMTFIRQLAVPSSDVSEKHLAPDTVLYVFGVRVQVEAGWRMQYHVVEQHLSLAGVRVE